jgi:hypothetical protein
LARGGRRVRVGDPGIGMKFVFGTILFLPDVADDSTRNSQIWQKIDVDSLVTCYAHLISMARISKNQ